LARLPFHPGACDIASHMTLTVTLAVATAVLLLAIFSGWRGARPSNPARGPRMIPWRFIMLLAAAALIPLVVHLLNLMGVATGNR
jgi:hypothetical protein